MTTVFTTNFRFVQSVVTDRNGSHYQSWNCHTDDYQSHGRPVSRQTSRATCQPTVMRDWWCDPARLVARWRTTCLWPLVICNRRFWTWLSTLLRPNLLVRSPTTCKTNGTICQRLICESSYFVVLYRSWHGRKPGVTGALGGNFSEISI